MGEVSSASKLVDLLVQAGLLKADERSEAVNMSKQTGLDITKLLTMHGYVTEATIKLGQEAVSLLQQKQIDNFIAVKALAKALERHIDLQAALEIIYQDGVTPVKAMAAPSVMSLEELLFEGGFLDRYDLDHHLATGQETGLSLGRVLLMRNAIDPAMLLRVLTAQLYSYQSVLKRDDIIAALRMTRLKLISFEEALIRIGIPQQMPSTVTNIRLGELLTGAGVVQMTSMIGALEATITQTKKLGEELIAHGQLDQGTLELALSVQNMVARGKLRPEHAPLTLKRLRELNKRWPDVLTEVVISALLPGDVLDLEQLLRYAGPVPEEILVRTRERFDRSGRMSISEYCAMLAQSGTIDDLLLKSAVRLVYLLKLNFLSPQQAIMTLQHARARGIYADEAIHELSGL
ncbi:MAG: hypothetical protein KGS72_08245 [Cyanobacteria bacterium REEB67]|nr:hypothetical protein [Cyanobacteria bacterium REEB67]